MRTTGNNLNLREVRDLKKGRRMIEGKSDGVSDKILIRSLNKTIAILAAGHWMISLVFGSSPEELFVGEDVEAPA